MFTLDSDILAILLAIVSFAIPAITAVREKKRRQHSGQTTEDKSPDELRKEEMEELFSSLLGIDTQQQEDNLEQEVSIVEESPDVEEIPYEEPLHEDIPVQEGTSATSLHVQQDDPMQNPVEEESKPLKKRLRENPKDMVLYAQILNPKYKEFEN